MTTQRDSLDLGWTAATMLNVLAANDREQGWRALRAAGWEIQEWVAVAPDRLNAIVMKGDGVWVPTTANDDATINHA